jgi:hypothetical protein
MTNLAISIQSIELRPITLNVPQALKATAIVVLGLLIPGLIGFVLMQAVAPIVDCPPSLSCVLGLATCVAGALLSWTSRNSLKPQVTVLFVTGLYLGAIISLL